MSLESRLQLFRSLIHKKQASTFFMFGINFILKKSYNTSIVICGADKSHKAFARRHSDTSTSIITSQTGIMLVS